MKLILDKIDDFNLCGEDIYSVYRTNYLNLGEGNIEIKREIKDFGLKDDMINKYPDIINLEEVAKELELR